MDRFFTVHTNTFVPPQDQKTFYGVKMKMKHFKCPHFSLNVPVKSSHSLTVIITITGSNLNKCVVIESV